MDFQINIKIILKIEIFYEYVFLLIDWWWFKFYVISLSFDTLLYMTRWTPDEDLLAASSDFIQTIRALFKTLFIV
jgi:hypothetical protein